MGAQLLELPLAALTVDLSDIDEIKLTLDPISDGDIAINQLFITEQVVSKPSTFVLFALGTLGLASYNRQRRRRERGVFIFAPCKSKYLTHFR